jgi:hypothetical protein
MDVHNTSFTVSISESIVAVGCQSMKMSIKMSLKMISMPKFALPTPTPTLQNELNENRTPSQKMRR